MIYLRKAYFFIEFIIKMHIKYIYFILSTLKLTYLVTYRLRLTDVIIIKLYVEYLFIYCSTFLNIKPKMCYKCGIVRSVYDISL